MDVLFSYIPIDVIKLITVNPDELSVIFESSLSLRYQK